jgi:hypothetical protein
MLAFVQSQQSLAHQYCCLVQQVLQQGQRFLEMTRKAEFEDKNV